MEIAIGWECLGMYAVYNRLKSAIFDVVARQIDLLHGQFPKVVESDRTYRQIFPQ